MWFFKNFSYRFYLHFEDFAMLFVIHGLEVFFLRLFRKKSRYKLVIKFLETFYLIQLDFDCMVFVMSLEVLCSCNLKVSIELLLIIRFKLSFSLKFSYLEAPFNLKVRTTVGK